MEKRGEGLHHITFEVDDVEKEIGRLSERGIELIDKTARPGFEGMVAFVHPKSLRGVLVELCQKA
jgi:methylmalonyl-CoA epimerase